MEPISVIDAVVRMAAATAAGFLIGFERERLDKVAGIRTLALVSCGSAVFVLTAGLSVPVESARIAAGIATGIGFIGAGVVIQDRGQVLGITTAATVWIAAALGVSAGMGQYLVVGFGTVLTLFVLEVLGLIDLSHMRKDSRLYEVVYDSSIVDPNSVSTPLIEAGLGLTLVSLKWSEESTEVSWRAVGRLSEHRAGIAALAESPSVTSLTMRD